MLIKSDDSAEAVYYDALTAADRCDQCAARAGVRVANNAGKDLTFCNHHWNDHHDALTASGFLVVLTGPGEA